jgi:hypothetical protein
MSFEQWRSSKVLLPVAAATAAVMALFALPAATASTNPSRTVAQQGQVTKIGATQARETIAKNHRGKITSVVRGDFGKNGVVRGNFNPDRFFVKKGQTYANGVLHAKLVRGGGAVVGHVSRQITVPVKNAKNPQMQAVCDVLHLVLGPLDLDLLGLQVHLDKVVLDVVARSGAGNLLGNLLCAVTGLLDGNQLRLANILNRILAILRV